MASELGPYGARRRRNEGVGWDVGERPSVPMPHMQYPLVSPDKRRSGLDGGAAEHVRRPQGRCERQRRLQELQEAGWASPRTGAYRSLGEVQDLPATGAQLRKAPLPSMHVEGPVLVQPSVAVDKSEAPSDSARMIPLGKRVKGFVTKFKYRYYSFTIDEALPIQLTLRCLTGDPDILVSNETTRPSREDHVWSSNNAGTDEIYISADDAYFTLGTYYLAVTSMYDSEYELCVEQIVSLPPVPVLPSETSYERRVRDNGYSVLSNLVAQAELRRREMVVAGTSVSASKMRIEPRTLYHELPKQVLQTVLAKAAQDTETVRSVTSKRSRVGADAKRHGPGVRDSVAVPVQPAVSCVCDPYLRTVCFGDAKPLDAQIGGTVQPEAPWLPPIELRTNEAEAEAFAERAPTLEQRHQMRQLALAEMKKNMEEQMRRVALGLQTEQALILSIKAAAFNCILNAESAHGSPSAKSAMRRMRAEAQQLLEKTMAEVAEYAAREAMKDDEHSKNIKGASARKRLSTSMRQMAMAKMLAAFHESEQPHLILKPISGRRGSVSNGLKATPVASPRPRNGAFAPVASRGPKPSLAAHCDTDDARTGILMQQGLGGPNQASEVTHQSWPNLAATALSDMPDESPRSLGGEVGSLNKPCGDHVKPRPQAPSPQKSPRFRVRPSVVSPDLIDAEAKGLASPIPLASLRTPHPGMMRPDPVATLLSAAIEAGAP